MSEIFQVLNNATAPAQLDYVIPRSRHYTEMEQRNRANQLDTWHVAHDLNARDLRILFKILAKHYEDGGRKRGAILRYIKYFREQEDAKNAKRLPLPRLRSQLLTKSS